MNLQTPHFGLYFSEEQFKRAQEQIEKQETLQVAFQWLKASSGDLLREYKTKEMPEAKKIYKAELNALGKAMEAAFRYRCLGDENAAKTAIEFLGQGFSDKDNLFDTIAETTASAQIFELVRLIFPDSQQWLKNFASYSDTLQNHYEEADILSKFWLIALKIVAGVLLEDPSRFTAGVSQYRLIIDEQIHPEGYIKGLVEGAKDAVSTYRKMLLAVGGLSLAAEAAHQVGEDLWKYEYRDVGMNTAASYLVYYYYYPDKWRWGEGLTEVDTQALFAEYGAFMEMLTSHHNPRGVELLLDEQRPFFSPILGGLTTLSHFRTEKRRRGWFG